MIPNIWKITYVPNHQPGWKLVRKNTAQIFDLQRLHYNWQRNQIKDVSDLLIHLDSEHDGPCRPPSVAAETFRLTTLARHFKVPSIDRSGRRNRVWSKRPPPNKRRALEGAARHSAGTPSERTRREFMGRSIVHIDVQMWKWPVDHGGKEHVPTSSIPYGCRRIIANRCQSNKYVSLYHFSPQRCLDVGASGGKKQGPLDISQFPCLNMIHMGGS